MPDLETKLARSRSALLDEIEQPPLAVVRRRATRIRRRRAAAAGATALAVLGVVGLAARPWQHDGPPSVTATDPPPIAPVYRGGGIEIVGLSPAPVYGLDGEIAEVEFADRDNGFAAAGCVPRCPELARTTDGGLSWQRATVTPTGSGPVDLVAFPGGHWLLDGDLDRSSADGSSWQIVNNPVESEQAEIGPDQLPRVEQPGGQVVVWSWDRGRLGDLRNQPQLSTARWVAPAPTADGAWWVGGLVGTSPAVSVSRDSGRSWTTTTLPAPADPTDSVTVSTLGTEAYAVAHNEAGQVLGIYHSTDDGKHFTATLLASGGEPAPFTGDLVPLLDGRLLALHPNGKPGSWWVSDDEGRTFDPIDDLPQASAIRRTYAGYVVYGLFSGSWAAFSHDGTNWQKLQVN
ncbi:sialidase family protein [Asanoa sp. NPDC049518]|uniref:sialidase family protein n=1 Tax=unclassified Asanoa TaxID=2685164 RepID=UPI00342378BF